VVNTAASGVSLSVRHERRRAMIAPNAASLPGAVAVRAPAACAPALKGIGRTFVFTERLLALSDGLTRPIASSRKG